MSSTSTVENVNSVPKSNSSISPAVGAQVPSEKSESNSSISKSEAIAFMRKVEDLAREGNNLKAEALEEVARMLGASCMNKYGRPSETAFVGFTLAMSHRNLTINARTQLANVANKAALAGGEARKPVFKTTANASALQGGFAYKLNLPATVEAAIG